MKYVVTWESRATASEELQARSLQVFSKWTPAEGTDFLQFVARVDGRGGFAVVETDDVARYRPRHGDIRRFLRF